MDGVNSICLTYPCLLFIISNGIVKKNNGKHFGLCRALDMDDTVVVVVEGDEEMRLGFYCAIVHLIFAKVNLYTPFSVN